MPAWYCLDEARTVKMPERTVIANRYTIRDSTNQFDILIDMDGLLVWRWKNNAIFGGSWIVYIRKDLIEGETP